MRPPLSTSLTLLDATCLTTTLPNVHPLFISYEFIRGKRHSLDERNTKMRAMRLEAPVINTLKVPLTELVSHPWRRLLRTPSDDLPRLLTPSQTFSNLLTSGRRCR